MKKYLMFALALIVAGCASGGRYTHPKFIGENDLTYTQKDDCETLEKNFAFATEWSTMTKEDAKRAEDWERHASFVAGVVGSLIYPVIWVANIPLISSPATVGAGEVDPYRQQIKELFASKKCKLVGFKVFLDEPGAKKKEKDRITCWKDLDTNFWLCKPNS
jgi:hypothetical protein